MNRITKHKNKTNLKVSVPQYKREYTTSTSITSIDLNDKELPQWPVVRTDLLYPRLRLSFAPTLVELHTQCNRIIVLLNPRVPPSFIYLFTSFYIFLILTQVVYLPLVASPSLTLRNRHHPIKKISNFPRQSIN